MQVRYTESNLNLDNLLSKEPIIEKVPDIIVSWDKVLRIRFFEGEEAIVNEGIV